MIGIWSLIVNDHTCGHCDEVLATPGQGSKIALVRSYLQVPQAAGHVKILIFLMKIKYFPIYANNFCDAGQVLILRYFKACRCIKFL